MIFCTVVATLNILSREYLLLLPVVPPGWSGCSLSLSVLRFSALSAPPRVAVGVWICCGWLRYCPLSASSKYTACVASREENTLPVISLV
jgi:hypothetical protein